MSYRIPFPKSLYLTIPLLIFVFTACSTPQEAFTDQAPPMTELPASIEISEPTEIPQPTPTEIPTSTPEPTKETPTEVLPTEVEVRPDITFALEEGDAERGRKLALKWRCFTCHVNEPVAPEFGEWQGLPPMAERADMRLADNAYTGFATTPQEYLIESIIDPSVYIVTGEWEYPMDETYSEDLSKEDLGDIIAWFLAGE